MTDIDLAKALEAMGSESTQKGAMTLTDMLKAADSVMNQVDKVITLLQKAEKSVICSTYVRMEAKKNGVELAPFDRTDTRLNPKSEGHAQMMANINQMTNDQLHGLIEAVKEYDEKHKK